MRTKLLQKVFLIVIILKMKEVCNCKKTDLSIIILMRTKLLQKMLLIVVVLEMKEAFNL